MSKPETKSRIIKKYPNRRLYDTEISRYITLDEIRQLVIDGAPFEVQDSRDGNDITRSILLQVISDQEDGGNPIFSTEVLIRFIRLYGDSMQPSISRYRNSASVHLPTSNNTLSRTLSNCSTATHPYTRCAKFRASRSPSGELSAKSS